MAVLPFGYLHRQSLTLSINNLTLINGRGPVFETAYLWQVFMLVATSFVGFIAVVIP